MSALHPAYLLGGLLVGATAAGLAAWVPWLRARHGVELGVASFVAVLALVVTQRYPLGVVALPAAGAVGGSAASLAARTRPTWRARWWLAALLAATGGVYLSVPDTEGAVLFGGLLVVSLVAWSGTRARGPARPVGVGLGALGGGVVAVAVGGGEPRTPTGWLAAKVAVVLLLGVAYVVDRRVAMRRPGVTSGRERPTP